MGDVSYLCYVPSIVGLRLIPNEGYIDEIRVSASREAGKIYLILSPS